VRGFAARLRASILRGADAPSGWRALGARSGARRPCRSAAGRPPDASLPAGVAAALPAACKRREYQRVSSAKRVRPLPHQAAAPVSPSWAPPQAASAAPSASGVRSPARRDPTAHSAAPAAAGLRAEMAALVDAALGAARPAACPTGLEDPACARGSCGAAQRAPTGDAEAAGRGAARAACEPAHAGPPSAAVWSLGELGEEEEDEGDADEADSLLAYVDALDYERFAAALGARGAQARAPPAGRACSGRRCAGSRPAGLQASHKWRRACSG
jgi:hypothetical protein